MRIPEYKVKTSVKVLINSIGILSVILGSIMILFLTNDIEAKIFHWISAITIILFGILIGYPFNKIRIRIDNEKITIPSIKFIPRTGVLHWDEIAELRSEYFLWPEQGTIKLISKNNNKKFLRFCMWGIPIELLKNIILHLSSDTKIELYSYLERKLEGKQTWFFKKQEYHIRNADYWHNICT